jgi:hypothetical protein
MQAYPPWRRRDPRAIAAACDDATALRSHKVAFTPERTRGDLRTAVSTSTQPPAANLFAGSIGPFRQVFLARSVRVLPRNSLAGVLSGEFADSVDGGLAFGQEGREELKNVDHFVDDFEGDIDPGGFGLVGQA